MSEILSPTDPDLRPYKNRGGKILLYHGWADPGISAYGTLDYFEKVVKAVGGQAQADMFARLFLAPGVHHCGGGPGPGSFDMLSALEAWVERGEAPSRIVASRAENGAVTRTRPLCSYPMVARYNGQGSVDDAANFTCAAR
jgi:feruloyl esterase